MWAASDDGNGCLNTSRRLQTAILHYINGGMPALAAQCIISRRWSTRASPEVLQSILDKLRASGQHESAAELLQHLERHDDALESYRLCAALSELATEPAPPLHAQPETPRL